MLNQLDRLDIFILLLLITVMPASGLIAAALKKRSSESYFLAGRSLKWWAVAGSIFGTNISVSHLVGMLGIGFSIGFAQSTYEFLSIPIVLVLAYVFVPAYRKLKVFTLSQFLGYRYNQQSRVVYTFLMLMLILVQMIAAFYIGGRTLMLLFNGTGFQLNYLQGIIIIAVITSILTVFGGMQSVVVTDNFQSVMMLLAGIIVAVATFVQPEIKGFGHLLELDAALPRDQQKMHLYLPSTHPGLPWSGVFTGLLTLNLFYWTTNQYVVQRALAAETDREAKLGVIASGFLKYTIPFISIATGVAAAHIFRIRLGSTESILPDDAFMHLVEHIIPAGYGLKGFILAGLTAATFSSVDSMMNSATTLLTIDGYQKFINKNATDKQLLRFGRTAVVIMILLTSFFALITYDPESAGNFFLSVSSRGAYFTPGIVAVFFIGIVWKKSNARAAVVTMIAAPFLSVAFEQLYAHWWGKIPVINAVLGEQLNFLHRVWLCFVGCVLLQWWLSIYLNKRQIQPQQQGGLLLHPVIAWRELSVFFAIAIIAVLAIRWGGFSFVLAAWIMAPLALLLFVYNYWKEGTFTWRGLLYDDRLYGGLLAAITVWALYYFA